MTVTVVDLAPGDEDAIAVVADGMRATLVEVLGVERGGSMYTGAWLRDRVRAHLDPDRIVGLVAVARSADGEVVGHMIVRRDHDDEAVVGLFSTTWVVPAWRRRGVADLLVDHGEAWMRRAGLDWAVTFTHPGNGPLVALFTRRGYDLSPVDEDFVRLARGLGSAGDGGH